jgi:wyosine [tRNA(Phe)-imidazoG37] synthetase (radical SAM superfamily)
MSTKPLTVADHSREAAGLTYIYPVVSRRAGGVSVGVNLNPNNACNWRCIYCQVPNLSRGNAPDIDLGILAGELRGFLGEVLDGDFMQTQVPEGVRRLNDIAISGSGEPTSSRQFSEVIPVIGDIMAEYDLVGRIGLVLITNGSLAGKPHVQEGMRAMASLFGEVWLKVDRGSEEGFARVNDVNLSPEQVLRNLESSASCCPTWVQTCMFATDGQPPSDNECAAYLRLLRQALERDIPLQGVLLYGLARLSQQPEAAHLSPLPETWLEHLAGEIRALGLETRVTP